MSEKYSKSHEWAKQEEDVLVIGISEHAQSQLGDIVYVELPEVGDSFEQGVSFSVLESVKSANDLYLPVAGEIVAVNEELEDNPSLVNSSPLNEGWICKIKPASIDLSGLLTVDEYTKIISEEE